MASPSVYETVRSLIPGDRVEVVHEVKVGFRRWTTTTQGTVERIDRRRHGLHYQRHADDKVFSDILVLRRDDGELTTVTIDEFTQVRRLEIPATAESETPSGSSPTHE